MRDVEIPNWLKGLPLAPEYRPTDTEFADPIAYISKIEKEASAFGICKVIPPLPKPSKKYVLHNLNRSLSKSPEFTSDAPSKMPSGDEEVTAVFTTRHQELGQNVKKSKGAVQSQQPTVQKQVWQSGEVYTLEQFESKSKVFARSLLSMIREVSPLVVEAMFWKAATEKPIYVEYANDVPGSGFGEPEGSFRYFLKRRRKRIFKKNCGASSVCRNHDVDTTAMNFYNDENSVMTNKLDLNICVEIPKASSGSSTLPSDETSQVSRQKRPNVSSEMEGTAGWKLSNSPWNLQVIARSPGSLTRFMPDDIPGVTSPMVYIGMLFSWFAWHVEDHELHSLNYLHTGSPKTWYAVPGDFAFAFEEVIRTQAYGGNIDRLAALKLLGEKTTLLSPELVIASGIPCCRLIQHPGEFVVTFPRAYHVGFSHGFNCGEAANFGTPQWLQVAKGAAVRRAAMSYLPMLSHQQLLYLLTMSFVSRVPRSLLPGARSSRLRDRQKEERELSVKKAFIEDILSENKLLTVLLEKESTYHAVLWNPESLPPSCKESQLLNGIATVAATSKENVTNPEEKNSQNNLFDEMSSYMETVNGLYLDDDDLSCDFQVDSGILACVACGILGFPFMSVVQPSGKAFMELMPVDHSLVQEGSTVSKSINSHISSDVDGIIKGTFSENLPPVPDHSVPQEDRPIPSTAKLSSGWIASSRFTRPHIFCLEHAVQIEELLRTKGGANVLVICHSDYQKMKAHAVATAEEIGCLFKYNEVPMESASHEDLDLINLAIAEERDECGEDWTAKLGINLRYCVKVQKNSPSKQVQHALTLGGLFSDMTPASTLSSKWQSRRPRSKLKLNHSANVKPCKSIQIKDTNLREQLNGSIVKNENKIIQYTRRNSNLKSASSARAGKDCAHPKEIKSSTCGNLDKCDTSRNNSTGSDVYASVGKSEMEHEVQALATSDLSKDFFPVQVASHATSTSSVRSVEAHIKNQTLEETNMDGKACNLLPTDSSEMQNKMKISEESSEKNETTFAGISSSLVIVVPTVERSEMQIDIIMEETKLTNEVHNLVTLNTSGGHCDMQTDGDVLNMVSDGANFPSSHVSDRVVETCDVPIEGEVAEIFCSAGEFSDCIAGNNVIQQEIKTNDKNAVDASVSREACAANELSRGAILEDKMLQEIQTTNSPAQESASSYVTLTDQPSGAPMEKRTEVPQESRTAVCSGKTLDDKVVHEADILNGNSTKKLVRSVTLTDQPGTAPVQERSESPQGTCAAGVLFNGVSSDKKVWQEVQTSNESGKEEPISGCVTVIDQLTTPGSVGESSNVLIEIRASDDLCHCMTLDNEPHETHATKRSEDRPIQGIATVKNQLTPASTGESPCNDVTSSNELDREIQTVSRSNREEQFLSCLTLINQTSLASVEESPKVLTETCAEYGSCKCATSSSEWEQEIPTASKSNGEEPVSSCLTWINQNSLASVEESPKLLTETCTEYDSCKCATLDNEVPSPASVEESSEVPKVTGAEENLQSCGEVCFSQDKSELENVDESTAVDLRSNAWKERKRKRKTEAEHLMEDTVNYNGFIRSPCEGLRSRARKDATGRSKTDMNKNAGKNPIRKNTRKPSASSVPRKDKKENTKGTHSCDLDGCRMSFKTKAELLLHKRNQCPYPGCGKTFSSHKYALLHERVHDDDRPIKCPWKGCTMSFKWAWAKIEHLRVHTGERPYQCKIEGCGLSFRFISDFSRHRRKTGHHHVN